MEATAVKRPSRDSSWLRLSLGLLLVYAVFVALRIVLATQLSLIPQIRPDEPLYFNLARSLWTAGEVSVRAQPITYDSLLYPLLLSPLFALPKSVNMMQAIQVLNALLMNAAIFPAWALARRITGSRRLAWFIAIVAILMPDMALTRMIVGENVGYPLLLLTLWLALRAFDTRKLPYALWAAVGCGLLYLLKPGLIAVAAALGICLLVVFLRERDRRVLWQLVTFAAFLSIFLIAWRLIAQHMLHIDYSVRSVYANQTPALTLANLQHVFNGTLLYLFFLPVACLVFPLLVPLAHARSLEKPDRTFLGGVYLAILLTVVGTCFFVYIDEFAAPFAARIHLRYVAGFFPVVYALSFSPSLDGKRMNGALVAMLSYLLAGTAAFTMDAITSKGSTTTIDALSLAYLIKDTAGSDTKTLYTLLLVFGALFGGYWLATRGWTRRVRAVMAFGMLLFATVNSVEAYWQQGTAGLEAKWVKDAQEVAVLLDGADYLSVTGDMEFFAVLPNNLDVQGRDAHFAVELDDLMENTPLGGAYASFMPQSYYLTHAIHPTPQVDWLVMDLWKSQRIIFSDPDGVVHTPERTYLLIPVGQGRPWVHSALSGFPANKLGDSSKLSIFDAAVCAQETVRVRISAMGTAGTLLTLRSGDIVHNEVLTGVAQWIDLEIPGTADGQPLRVFFSSYGDVYVDNYEVEGMQPSLL